MPSPTPTGLSPREESERARADYHRHLSDTNHRHIPPINPREVADACAIFGVDDDAAAVAQLVGERTR